MNSTPGGVAQACVENIQQILCVNMLFCADSAWERCRTALVVLKIFNMFVTPQDLTHLFNHSVKAFIRFFSSMGCGFCGSPGAGESQGRGVGRVRRDISSPLWLGLCPQGVLSFGFRF